jgi:putative ABC transport system permease protein
MRLHTVSEGIGIALSAIRENKLRSALTILGVVIGVSTVMAMASIVAGLRTQIINTIEVAGPTTFYVMRFFSQTPLNPDALPREVRVRPVLRREEAELIARLPEVAYSGIWIQLFQRLGYGAASTQLATIFAADDRYMEIQGGTLLKGRFQEIAAVIAYETGRRYFRYDETNALWIVVKPRDGVTVAQAQDAVTVALRRYRGLRPGDPNTFDMITQDQILDMFNQMSSVFFLVMIALSSVALMVGGIGVMGIMMVSVTDRTREIGVRKALGATRREILWQFLVEAATLTLVGGGIGVLLGLGAGQTLKGALGFEGGPPMWSAGVAVAVSIAIGLAFGVLPANRAARLDPVEALRYE